MQFLLPVLAMAAFTSALSMRALDPILPQIASDLLITIQTAALASSAYAITNALSQPALGIIGDIFGKIRVMSVCLLLVGIGNFATAFSPSFDVLLVSRVLCGMGAGGVMPVALGLVGDLVPIAQRQVSMSRVSAGGMTGFLLGASLSGIIGDFAGWRFVFLFTGCCIFVAVGTLVFSFRKVAPPPPKPVSLELVMQTYRRILAHPHARICYATVFLEGLCVAGLFPFISSILAELGQTRPAIAGFVLAGFPIGTLLYTVLVSRLLPLLREQGLMLLGGILGASQLVAIGFSPPWQLHFFCLIIMGLGFFMLHGCMQTFVSEIAPQARGTAVSLHAMFVFIGSSIGPVFYGHSLIYLGKPATLTISGTMMLLIGLTCSKLLRHEAVEH